MLVFAVSNLPPLQRSKQIEARRFNYSKTLNDTQRTFDCINVQYHWKSINFSFNPKKKRSAYLFQMCNTFQEDRLLLHGACTILESHPMIRWDRTSSIYGLSEFLSLYDCARNLLA